MKYISSFFVTLQFPTFTVAYGTFRFYNQFYDSSIKQIGETRACTRTTGETLGLHDYLVPGIFFRNWTAIEHLYIISCLTYIPLTLYFVWACRMMHYGIVSHCRRVLFVYAYWKLARYAYMHLYCRSVFYLILVVVTMEVTMYKWFLA